MCLSDIENHALPLYVVYTLCTDKNITKLQRLLNRALHIVFRATRYTPTAELLRKANIMSVKDRIQFNLIKLVNKNVLSHSLRYPLITSHSTRAVEQRLIRLPKPRTSKFRRSPYYKSIQAWKALDNELRNIMDPMIFKNRLKASFLLD